MNRRSLLRSILFTGLAAFVLAAAPYLSNLTATIALNGNLSAAIETKDHVIVAIQMPAAWDAADLTFQASYDGTTYNNVYNIDGDEYTITAAASRYIVLSPLECQWARYVKIRSGTSGTPVTQTAARSITVVTRKVE